MMHVLLYVFAIIFVLALKHILKRMCTVACIARYNTMANTTKRLRLM
jgi:hypothetical protein